MKEYLLKLRITHGQTGYRASVANGDSVLVSVDKDYPTETDAAVAVLEHLAARHSFGEVHLGQTTEVQYG